MHCLKRAWLFCSALLILFQGLASHPNSRKIRYLVSCQFLLERVKTHIPVRSDNLYVDHLHDFGNDGDDTIVVGLDFDNNLDLQDEDGNFVVGDMFLSPEQYDYEFGPEDKDGVVIP